MPQSASARSVYFTGSPQQERSTSTSHPYPGMVRSHSKLTTGVRRDHRGRPPGAPVLDLLGGGHGQLDRIGDHGRRTPHDRADPAARDAPAGGPARRRRVRGMAGRRVAGRGACPTAAPARHAGGDGSRPSGRRRLGPGRLGLGPTHVRAPGAHRSGRQLCHGPVRRQQLDVPAGHRPQGRAAATQQPDVGHARRHHARRTGAGGPAGAGAGSGVRPRRRRHELRRVRGPAAQPAVTSGRRSQHVAPRAGDGPRGLASS